MSDYVWLALGALIIVLQVVVLVRLRAVGKQDTAAEQQQHLFLLRQELDRIRMEIQQDVQGSFRSSVEMLTSSQGLANQAQNQRLEELTKLLAERTQQLQASMLEQLRQMDGRLMNSALQSEQKMDSMRRVMVDSLTSVREENSKKLDEMRATVDEKLQKTLEERISKSFSLVNEQLGQVQKGLGEMQKLATGVGDLKNILSNVKTRGVLGEIQLGAILEQIMPREQYEENVAVTGSSERVEYAIRLPGSDEGCVYLPIDAKFPADMYSALMDAYEQGDKAVIAAATEQLKRTIRAEAKKIHDKYIEPPYTTDFAVMFLPFEGLYAEVVRAGMVEELQRLYQVTIAGPTTMAAMLNSFHMGFRTLAIQKHSSEVWKVLGAVKTEFDTFGTVLGKTQERLQQANSELDKLVGTRTRSIQRKLRSVERLPEGQSRVVLELEEQAGIGGEEDAEK